MKKSTKTENHFIEKTMKNAIDWRWHSLSRNATTPNYLNDTREINFKTTCIFNQKEYKKYKNQYQKGILNFSEFRSLVAALYESQLDISFNEKEDMHPLKEKQMGKRNLHNKVQDKINKK